MGAIQRVAGTLPIALDSHHSPARSFLGPRWVTFGRSRVRESRSLGSVGAKAEWLSYPTIPSLSHAYWQGGGGRAKAVRSVALFADLEEFVHDHHPHGTMTGDATEPAWNGYLVTVECSCGVVFERW